MWKHFYFKQLFSIITQFSYIWPIERTLSGATTPGKIRPGGDSNEGILCIPQSSSITGAIPSDCLVSYVGQSFREYYPSPEMQSAYSTVSADLADWAVWTWITESISYQDHWINFSRTINILMSLLNQNTS